MNRRALALLLLATAAVGVLAAGGALAQATKDGSGEKSDAQCYGHHREEGFRSMDLYPESVQSVAAGQPFEFQLTVRNPWLHELRDVYAFVNTSRAPGILFPGAKDPAPFEQAGTLPLNPQEPSRAAYPLEVEDNATLILARLAGDLGPLRNGDFDLFLRGPSGKVFNATPDEPAQWRPNRPFGAEVVSVPYAQILEGGIGTWSIEVVYAGGALPQAAYEVEGAVYYNLSRSTELFVRGPAVLPSGEAHTFTFTLIAANATDVQAPPAEGGGLAMNLVYGGKAIAYNEHTDPNAEDWGNYTKWSVMSFALGTQTVKGPADAGIQASALVTLGPSLRGWGEVLGFAASMVLVPAIVLGGVFGRGSIAALNRAFGGARRRVLFHNASSYGLLVFSLLHMFVLLAEPIWPWTHGLVLGGLALAAMVGLALTGAFQRRLVVAWGFPRWRFVHFALGVLMVVFVVAHLVVDGTHFEAVRAMFGDRPVA